MVDSELNFQQCSFLLEFHILLILLPKHPLCSDYIFCQKIPRFIQILRKMEYISKQFKMVNPRWWMLPVPFLAEMRGHHDIIAIFKDHLCVNQLP